ncbi:MAG: DNA ligase D [Bacillaceae bacterium]|nr:DNA ligase D [Bacillaceae bacterium]
MWKPMLPKLSESVPSTNDWAFEVKYDGFRAMLEITESGIQLISRNGKDLRPNFPEITGFCEEQLGKIRPFLPVRLDGEIVILNTPLQANFPILQQRGRMKRRDKIQEMASRRPASLLAFDILLKEGNKLTSNPYDVRKNLLFKLFHDLGWDGPVHGGKRIAFVPAYDQLEELREEVFTHFGEGIIAKRKKMPYEEGKRTGHWLKIKNWRNVKGVVTGFNPQNQYFQLSVYHEDQLVPLGSVKHGFSDEEYRTLSTTIRDRGKKSGRVYSVPPGICVQVHCLDATDGELREPVFDQFRLDLVPEECTAEEVKKDLLMFPDEVEVTHPDKVLWPEEYILKTDYMMYLRQISPYMLPFFNDKPLTLIRYPHGVQDTSFYQKHRADYAPDFVHSYEEDGEAYILCKNVSALIWLGNQGTIEFHTPFNRIRDPYPDEIVIDLDPPSRNAFPSAIQAARLLKGMCDQLGLHSFVKTSGNKGLQIHIPLPLQSLSYQESRHLTKSMAELLVKEHPDLFTVERLKKKRGNRLYIDYVQHWEGKTIIAPFSARATEEATVAAPLFWEEVNDSLDPTSFTIMTMPSRLKKMGSPWQDYDEKRNRQPIDRIRMLLGNLEAKV